MKTLIINHYPTIIWVLLSLILAAGLFAFFTFYLIPEWQAKRLARYENYIKILESDISMAKEQWEMDTLAHQIRDISKVYKGKVAQGKLRNDANELAGRWLSRERELAIPKEFSKS